MTTARAYIHWTANGAVHRATLADGGGTFNVKGAPVKPSTGFAVGIASGDGVTITGVRADAVPDYLYHFAALAERYPEADAFGTWHRPDGAIVLDPVMIVRSIDVAIRLARANRQEAIYSFASGETVDVPPARHAGGQRVTGSFVSKAGTRP